MSSDKGTFTVITSEPLRMVTVLLNEQDWIVLEVLVRKSTTEEWSRRVVRVSLSEWSDLAKAIGA